MTLDQLSYNLLNILRGGHSFNDENVSLDQIKYIIEYQRGLLLRRAIDKGDRVRDFEQDLDVIACLDASSEFPEIGENHLILKTEIDIPTPVRTKYMEGITAVTSPDRRFNVQIINYHRARWYFNERYTKDEARAFILNDRVYVAVNQIYGPIFLTDEDEELEGEGDLLLVGDDLDVSDTTIKTGETTYGVVVRGVFERPREAHLIATDTEFDDAVDHYPFPYDLIPPLAQRIISGELKIMTSEPLDDETNHLPDSQTNV